MFNVHNTTGLWAVAVSQSLAVASPRRRRIRSFARQGAQLKLSLSKHVTVVGTLTKQHGDKAVAEVLEAGMRSTNPHVKALAKKLQDEQFRLWYKSEPFSGVFRLLAKDTVNPLKGDAFDAWRRFFNHYNDQADFKITQFNVLRSLYGDREFAGLIQRTKFESESAVKFERELFNSWVAMKWEPEKLASTVFKLKPNELTRVDKAVVDEYTRWWTMVHA